MRLYAVCGLFCYCFVDFSFGWSACVLFVVANKFIKAKYTTDMLTDLWDKWLASFDRMHCSMLEITLTEQCACTLSTCMLGAEHLVVHIV